MGLPSGLLWAKKNVGADAPTDDGLYFSWGNVDGHAAGSGYEFSQEVYDSTPGKNIETDLGIDSDAAHVNLGEPWRMPTKDEFQELYDNCTSEWTSLDGVAGRLFTSNINGKSVFLPASGYYNGTFLSSHGATGVYWASSYYSDTFAYYLQLNSTEVHPQYHQVRHWGFTVRAVRDP